MAGLLGEKETLTRDRVRQIFQKKEYSYLEEKVNILEVRDDSLLLKVSFLLEYKTRMISIEEKEPIAVPFKDFKVEDWEMGFGRSRILSNQRKKFPPNSLAADTAPPRRLDCKINRSFISFSRCRNFRLLNAHTPS